ncbi:unnamed protein product [Caenorhabditis bovis]|uniref:Uncharacterized protein n=1 Tax=Caenorhabditis bovis TaxID=2654633 RepID=A0A8S1EI44_9PELO|nr:unnamed protein product [Caenorhabditis bovis]
MLSLLSLIIASGTVLRADTEQWEPVTYPDPRTNATECNVPYEGTLCDPDHILTDTWRQTILDNVSQHMAKLEDAKILYNEEASPECYSNTTEPVQIFIILAKRIHTASNQSITSNDLTQFGHGLREAFGLDTMSCKNYVLVLGVELAKEIYLWTGSDLAIPKEQLDNSLAQYKNLFTERNYMEGLNKIVDEISSLLLDPFKELSTTTIAEETTENVAATTSETSTASEHTESAIPSWVYVVIVICVCTTFAVLIIFTFFFIKFFRNRKGTTQIFPKAQQNKSTSIVVQRNDDNNQLPMSHEVIQRKSSIDSENSHHPRSEHGDSIADNSSISSIDQKIEDEYYCQEPAQKVEISDKRLSTDNIIARRNSDIIETPSTLDNQFSSL